MNPIQYSSQYNDIRRYTFWGHERSGLYGNISLAQCKETKENVAIKRLLFENTNEPFPIEELSDIRILRKMSHDNVIELIEICTGQETNPLLVTFYLVFEFCAYKLSDILGNLKLVLQLGDVKNITRQLFMGTFYLHTKKIVHRDLRPSNLLLTRNGILKLADFALATTMGEPDLSSYSTAVVTPWYRPPELLLEQPYNNAVDVWSAGCILAEFWTRVPILQGFSNLEQMSLIVDLFGSLTSDTWPGIEEIKSFKNMNLPLDKPNLSKQKLQRYVKDLSCLHLLEMLLVPNPVMRYSALSALSNPFLRGSNISDNLLGLIATIDQFERRN